MASKPTRRLVLLRHAKSAWPDLPDHDRPLAGRGRGDAPASAAGCERRAAYPISSGALPRSGPPRPGAGRRRAGRGPAGELRAPDVRRDRRRTGRPRPPGSGQDDTLLLVGHNPGIQDLAVTLSAARTRHSRGPSTPGDTSTPGTRALPGTRAPGPTRRRRWTGWPRSSRPLPWPFWSSAAAGRNCRRAAPGWSASSCLASCAVRPRQAAAARPAASTRPPANARAHSAGGRRAGLS